MDCKIKEESLSTTHNNLPILIGIKSEENDYPELVDKSELSENTCNIEAENVEKSKETAEMHSCRHCSKKFPELKYVQVHEVIHGTKLHCPVCDRLFKSDRNFILHIEAHLQNPLRCQQCPEIFFDKRAYNLHSYSHKKIKTYTCDYCLKEWSNKKDLTVHIRVHTNERPFSCEVCGKSFKQRGGLSAHITTHSKDMKVDKEKIHCDICNGSYSSISSLNKHVRKIHGTGKTFPCRKCGELFLNFKQMKEHKRQEHPEVVYNRICPLCSQIFSCRETFIKHQHTHMESGEQVDKDCFATPIDCILCGEQIHGMRAFSKHQQVHLLMSDEEVEACTRAKTFNCKVCGKQCNFKKNLFRHMDLHLEKKFECGTHCSEKFTYLGLRIHMEWLFEPFHCSECNETFIGKKNLRKHYRVHPVMAKFTCKVCGVRFRYRRLLITHWRMQHNLKCHLCFNQFVTHLDLKKHIKLKHKVKCELPEAGIEKMVRDKKKYQCKFCKRSLDTLQLLADHMKVHKKKCYQCENCKKNFLYFRNWMFHIKQEICLKYFNNKDEKSHLNCVLCNKNFNTVPSLMNHMRRHSTILKCKFCNSKFKQKNLDEHIRRAHPEKTEYSCDKCSQSFCILSDLCMHRKDSHEMVIVKEEPKEGVVELSVRECIGMDEKDAEVDSDNLVSIKRETAN